jgi:hypothetical protein
MAHPGQDLGLGVIGAGGPVHLAGGEEPVVFGSQDQDRYLDPPGPGPHQRGVGQGGQDSSWSLAKVPSTSA